MGRLQIKLHPHVKCRQRVQGDNPPPPPSSYEASIYSCQPYHTKGMCNGRCGHAEDHKLHTVEQDAPLDLWAEVVISILEGITA